MNPQEVPLGDGTTDPNTNDTVMGSVPSAPDIPNSVRPPEGSGAVATPPAEPLSGPGIASTGATTPSQSIKMSQDIVAPHPANTVASTGPTPGQAGAVQAPPMQATPPVAPMPSAPIVPGGPAGGMAGPVNQGFVGNGGYQMPSAQTANSKRKRFIKPLIISAGVIVMLAGALGGFLFWQSTQLPLETFKGDGYSMLVPSGFVKSEENGATVFTEDSTDETNKSTILSGVQDLGNLTQEEFDTVKKASSEESTKAIFDSFNKNGSKAINQQCKRAETDDQISYVCSADVEKNGEAIGTLHFRLIVNRENGMGIVAVAAREGDKAVEKKSEQIMNSFAFE